MHKEAKSLPPNVKKPPVSVVICARNEEKNLQNFLPSILEQDYPNFEVIVVDDCSEDNTDLLLNSLKQKYGNLRTTTIKKDAKFSHGKKLALTIGIKAAAYNWVLLTDADCKPESSKWIDAMASNFVEPHKVVIGYGGYFSKKGIVNKLIRFDSLFIAMQYIGFAKMGKPYMGVGRNLAYQKELFFQNKGFASHSHLYSGDDDLFIHEVATRNNSTVEIRPDAQTRSKPNTTLSGWLAQKRRHLTSSTRYKISIKLWLGAEPLSRVMFWVTGVALLCLSFNPIIMVTIMALRLIVMQIIIIFVSIRLNEKKIFLLSLLYDVLSPILFGSLLLANRFTKKPMKWN